ncbi:MAG: DNA translocase FtsK 4TM domain-containing protein, partial [Candidatus Promineifilaceae bacterium]
MAGRPKSTPRSDSRTRRSRRPATPPPTWDERLINFLAPWKPEFAGLLLFLAAAIILLALAGLTRSSLLRPVSSLLRQLAGWGAYPLLLSVVAAGLYLLLRRSGRPLRVAPARLIGFELILASLMALVHLAMGEGLPGALRGRGGGLIGWALSDPLREYLGPLLTALILIGLLLLGGAVLFGVRWGDVVRWLSLASLQLHAWADDLEQDVALRRTARQVRPLPAAPSQAALPERRLRPAPPAGDELIIIDDSAPGGGPAPKRDGRLPPYELLDEGASLALSPEEIDAKKQLIEQTLLDFGLPALVTEIRRGPAVTQFGVQPGYLVRPRPDGVPRQYKVRV